MTEAVPILELGVVLLIAGLVGVLARRLGLPAVVGYLVVGLVVGPFTPGYVADKHQIQVLADVGVVLLLFEVGIELDLRSLAKEPRGILVAVPLQVAVVTALGAVVATAVGSPPLGAITLGLVAALSSSVVVVNITRSRRRTTDAITERALVVWRSCRMRSRSSRQRSSRSSSRRAASRRSSRSRVRSRSSSSPH